MIFGTVLIIARRRFAPEPSGYPIGGGLLERNGFPDPATPLFIPHFAPFVPIEYKLSLIHI